MARTYRRSANGRFAGGAGAGGGSSSPGGGGRKVAKNGSKAMAQSKPKAARGTTLKASAGAVGKKAGNAAKKAGKFAVKNPRLVVAAGYGALVVTGHMSQKKQSGALAAATKYAQDHIASKRGIGANKPGAGLKASKRNVRGAYKIRSK